MKLPDALNHLLHKKPESRKLLLSLVVDTDSVGVAVWFPDDHGKPEILAHAWESVIDDTWDSRTQAVDRALSIVEDKANVGAPLVQVVLGLPAAYLTEEGNIAPDVRVHIKKLTKMLELAPIGFVPLTQALAFLLKRDEGVPANAILVGVSKKSVTISLYKIGTLVGQHDTENSEGLADRVESIIKSFDGEEILPSRMLIYGGESDDREKVRAQLLKHPWPTRVNFLHFPKVELLPQESIVGAVSLAGASELATTIREEEVAGEEPLSVPAPETRKVSSSEVNKEIQEKEEDQTEQEEESGELVGKQQSSQEAFPEEESNVTMVDPGSLGFKQNEDILEVRARPVTKVKPKEEIEEKEEERSKRRFPSITLPAWPLPKFSFAALRFPALGIAPWVPLVAILGGIVLVAVFLYWLLGKATVTVLVIPQTVEVDSAVTVDPTATVVDSATKTIPGFKQEKSVSGEKTIPVVGKKNVGDPAKGNVTIFNKTTTPRTFPKGTILTTGALQFTLDDAVSVASASVDANYVTTPGKANAAITASAIGNPGNMVAGTEFNFKDILSSVAVARNDQPLTGGTSKEVTVVTRADYDALTKALTTDLVDQAKKDLAGSVGGGQKLIDATVKTTIGEKSFTQELDQEAAQLHGKLTATVSGISYGQDDVKKFFTDVAAEKIPSGYALAPSRTELRIADATVKKDGKIMMSVHLKSVALPNVDTNAVAAGVVGKKLTAATEFLKHTAGVAGAEFSFSWMPWKDRLPLNKNNIFVTIAIQE